MTKSCPIRRRSTFVMLVLLGVAAAGCGSAASVSPDESATISLILDVSDATRSEAEFTAVFASGHAPAKGMRRKFTEYSFSPVGKPSITENDATMTVQVSDANDDPIGEVTWNAVKEHGKWKLATAPLP